MMSAQNSSGLAPQCLKMFEHSSSSLGLHCQKMFKQISSNLVSQMSQRRLLASLQAPFLKEKKVYASCALSSKERKSSWFLIILINSVIFVHARSVVCGSVDHCFTKLKKKLCARRRDSFIVSKKRSSDSTKKFKGVPDESTISLEASNVKNGSKTGVPDEEKLNLEWEGRCGQYSNELEVSQAYGQAHMYKLQVTSGTAKPKETTYHGLMHISKDAEFWCHVAIAGLNPEHMQDVFLATNYPKIATRFSFEGKIASYSNQAVPNQRKRVIRLRRECCSNLMSGCDWKSVTGSGDQKKLRNQIFRALTESADVPSRVTETTDTTSTLHLPRSPLQNYSSSRYLVER
ncbi:hypothetical protein Tco_1226105 [Tanacetum coccineum]